MTQGITSEGELAEVRYRTSDSIRSILLQGIPMATTALRQHSILHHEAPY